MEKVNVIRSILHYRPNLLKMLMNKINMTCKNKLHIGMIFLLGAIFLLSCESQKYIIEDPSVKSEFEKETLGVISYSNEDIPRYFMKLYKEISHFNFVIANPNDYYAKTDLYYKTIPNKQLIFHGCTESKNYYVMYYRHGSLSDNVCYVVQNSVETKTIKYVKFYLNNQIDNLEKFNKAFP